MDGHRDPRTDPSKAVSLNQLAVGMSMRVARGSMLDSLQTILADEASLFSTKVAAIIEERGHRRIENSSNTYLIDCSASGQ